MTKAQITREISLTAGIDKKTVATVVDKFIETVKNAVKSNDNVYLRGFGTFAYRVTPGKKARNINTGEVIVLPPRGTVKFKPAKEFKEAVK